MFGNLSHMFGRNAEPPLPPPAPAIPLPDRLRGAEADTLANTLQGVLLAGGYALQETNADGDTALHIACHKGSLEAARLLIEAGADVNAANKRGVTPLMAAASAIDPAMLRLLLEHGADPKIRNGNDTAIDCMVEWNSYRRRDMPDADEREMACFTLLQGLGLRPGNAWSKSLIYKEHPALAALLPEMAAARDFGALVEKQDLPAMKMALDGGMKPDVGAEYGGQAALCYAAEKNNVPMINLLLDYGADIDRESYYRTPLQAAVIAGARQAFTRLLDAGANPDLLYTSDRYPDTTLLELAQSCKTDTGMGAFVEKALARRAESDPKSGPPKPHTLLKFEI